MNQEIHREFSLQFIYHESSWGNYVFQEWDFPSGLYKQAHKHIIFSSSSTSAIQVMVPFKIEIMLIILQKVNQQQQRDEEILVDKPIFCKSAKLAQYEVYDKDDEKSKDDNFCKQSQTLFKMLWYDSDSDSSLIQCKPLTGRTHQIRVHLKYLGFPILNDLSYGGRKVGNILFNNHVNNSDQDLFIRKKIKISDDQYQEKFMLKEQQLNMKNWNFDDDHVMEIFLHSQKYKFGDIIIEAKYPYWANNNFNFGKYIL